MRNLMHGVCTAGAGIETVINGTDGPVGPYDVWPQHPPSGPQGQSQGVIAVRIVAAVFGGSAAVPWLLVVWMILSSAYSTNPAADPHGYGIVFGFLAYVPLSLVCAALLPLTLPKRLWWRGFAVSVLLLVGITGLLILALNQA